MEKIFTTADTESTEIAQRLELNSTLCATSVSSPVSVVNIFSIFGINYELLAANLTSETPLRVPGRRRG
jgi:hypothetical protein